MKKTTTITKKKKTETEIPFKGLEARAIAKYLRISPYKVRRVADQVRGRNALDALQILKNLPQNGATYLIKVIASAVANAKQKGMSEALLKIDKLLVNEGVQMKRFRPRARGRMFGIIKRTSHIIVHVVEAGGRS